MTKIYHTQHHHYPSAFRGPEYQPKPCPFCNSQHITVYAGRNANMECMNCGAEGPHTIQGPEVAIDLWDHRQ